jgi:hypothetical protein
MGGINARIFASEHLTQLPPEPELREALERTKRAIFEKEKKKRSLG